MNDTETLIERAFPRESAAQFREAITRARASAILHDRHEWAAMWCPRSLIAAVAIVGVDGPTHVNIMAPLDEAQAVDFFHETCAA